MNNLLIFFAFPIATIIISAILQKILKCPIAVAAFVFAVFIIVTFAAFDETFLIATLVYTVIALITAFIVKLTCRNNNNDDNQSLCERLETISLNLANSNNGNNNNNNCNNSLSEALEAISDNNNDNNCNCNSNNSGNSNCGCGCNNRYRSYRYRRF